MSSELASKTCVPCRGGVAPLTGEALHNLSHQLPEWHVHDEHHITRTFRFPDFKSALVFVNRVGDIAEEQGHHPLNSGWRIAPVFQFRQGSHLEHDARGQA